MTKLSLQAARSVINSAWHAHDERGRVILTMGNAMDLVELLDKLIADEHGCAISEVSSRVCQHGTKSCTVDHDKGEGDLIEDLQMVIDAHRGMQAGDVGSPAMTIRVCRTAIEELRKQSPTKSSPTGHKCPDSPTGVCEYDEENDPCRDSCIHCGDPLERK